MRLLVVLAAAAVPLLACDDRRTREGAVPPPALSRPDLSDAQTGRTPGEPPVALPTGVREVRGVVASASAHEVVVRPDGGGEPVALEVPSGTPVTVDGRKAGPERIRPGAPVYAAYSYAEGKPRALRLDVRPSGR